MEIQVSHHVIGDVSDEFAHYLYRLFRKRAWSGIDVRARVLRRAAVHPLVAPVAIGIGSVAEHVVASTSFTPHTVLEIETV